VLAVVVGGAALQLVYVILRVTVLLQAIQSGFSPVLMGFVQASFSVASLLALHLGRAADRAGARPAMLASTVAVIAAALLMSGWPAVGAGVAAGLLVGAGNSAYYVAHLKLLGELTHSANRLAMLSFSSVIFSVATSSGPFVAGAVIDLAGHRAAYALTLPVAFAALGLAWWSVPRRPAPGSADGARLAGARALLADRRTGSVYIVSSMLTTAFESFNFLAPIYAARIGLSATLIGAMLSTMAVSMLLVRICGPYLARRVAPFSLMLAALLVVCPCYVIFPLSHWLPALFAVAFVIGASFGIVNPVTQALLYELSPPGRSGEALGLRQVLVGVGHVSVPIVFGGIGAALGSVLPIFWGLAGAGLACVGVGRYRWPKAGAVEPA
jgi:MFS family permease